MKTPLLAFCCLVTINIITLYHFYQNSDNRFLRSIQGEVLDNFSNTTLLNVTVARRESSLPKLRTMPSFTYEEGVIVGHDKYFQTILRTFDYIFIDFYADWCPYCQELAPEFATAAQLIEDPDIKFVKLNADDEKRTRRAYKLEEYPLVVLYDRRLGRTVEFEGHRNAMSLLMFVEEYVVRSRREIAEANQAQQRE